MPQIHDFHAHIYYDPDQIDQARALGQALQQRFGLPLGLSTSDRSVRIRAARAR